MFTMELESQKVQAKRSRILERNVSSTESKHFDQITSSVALDVACRSNKRPRAEPEHETKLRHQAFPPVVGANPRVLILGSAPGVVSLQKRQYYGHPQNHFWRILGSILRLDLYSMPYENRLPLLMDRGIALWDVIHTFERKGSSDAHFKRAEMNDFLSFFELYPSIEVVACNGGKSASVFDRMLKDAPELRQRLRVVQLPSSSPAHAMKNAVQEKTRVWIEKLALKL